MLQKLKTKQQSGFTIIEVMIVLAIAGLILLIVFLAVPALQRNATNTSLKNDVSGILGAVNTYTNNNNGAIPPSAFLATNGTVTVGSTSATCPTGANCATAKVSTNIKTVTLSKLAGTPTAPANVGDVAIYTDAVCGGTNNNVPTTTDATLRNVAAYYKLQGNAVECTAS